MSYVDKRIINSECSGRVNVERDGSQQTNIIYFNSKWLHTAVLPSICLFGIIGNIVGAIVIRRCGLQKSSNCLLFALALIDLSLCFGDTNPPNALLYYHNKFNVYEGYGSHLYKGIIFTEPRWEMSYRWAFTCFVIYKVMLFISKMAERCSNSITVLITLERLIAVFAPLHFTRVVTPYRVVVGVVASVLFWIPWVTYDIARYYFHYYWSYNFKVCAGRLEWNPGTKGHMYPFLRNNVMIHLSQTFPLLFVSTGSLCIGLKVHYTNRTRSKLGTGSVRSRSSSQTTRTLIAVCVVFCLTRFMNTATPFLSDIYLQNSDQYKKNPVILNVVVEGVRGIARSMIPANSASNFLIYVISNNKFRTELLDMVRIGKGQKKSSTK